MMGSKGVFIKYGLGEDMRRIRARQKNQQGENVCNYIVNYILSSIMNGRALHHVIAQIMLLSLLLNTHTMTRFTHATMQYKISAWDHVTLIMLLAPLIPSAHTMT